MKLIVQLTLITILVTTVAPNLKAITIKEDDENVVATCLAGNWTLLDKLTKRLMEDPSPFDISFKIDNEVANKLPKKWNNYFSNKTVYLTGWITLDGKKIPFLLSTNRGNPHIFYFKDRGNQPMSNIESFNIFVAKAEKKENDILFIGGDFNNTPFMALERAPEEEKGKMTLRGYLPTFEMQHPLIYDNQTYFDRYDKDGNMVGQNIVVYENGLTPPSDKSRPIELRGKPEKVSLGGRPGTRGSYSNTILKVKSWEYLKKHELPKK